MGVKVAAMSGSTMVTSDSMVASAAPLASVIRMILPPRAATSCMFETVFSNTRSNGAITTTGTFSSMRASERIGGAAGEIEDVSAFGDLARQLLDLRLGGQCGRHQTRDFDEAVHQL